MSKDRLKLYRGLSAEDFSLISEEVLKENKAVWKSLLENRLLGIFDYPLELDKPIRNLQKNLRLERQYFTDSKEIAEGYAKKVGGILVEISVSLKDVLKHFELEFQNFAQRKTKFEVVYCIRGKVLAEYNEKWKLKVKKIKK
jgi:hypothetical protein